jgi:hypothetical protein
LTEKISNQTNKTEMMRKESSTEALNRQLETFLAEPEKTEALRQFMESELCSENLLFLLAVQDLQKLEDETQIFELVKAIHKKYINPRSATMVNIPAEVNTKLNAEFEKVRRIDISLFFLFILFLFFALSFSPYFSCVSDSQ